MLKSLLRAACVAAFFSSPLYAQELDSLLNMSAFTAESDLQKELNKSTKVASGVSLTSRETPGILSVITREEIQNSGARDITDVLRMVPGFDVAQDINFVQSIALRGNWANEGKVLVLLDGQQMNELLYQTTPLGNRFAVELIERIEIIRGPGSAIYGGSAEYGVINIITKATTLNGAMVFGTTGFNAGNVARTNAGVMIAQNNGGDFSWDATASFGKANVSDGDYQDLLGDYPKTNLAGKTDSDPKNFSTGVRYKGLSVRTMYDEFYTGDASTYVSYKSGFADVKYDWKINDKLTLTPQLKYIDQKPWVYGFKETNDNDFEVSAKRAMGELSGSYTLSRKMGFTFGSLYFHDTGTDKLKDSVFMKGNSLSLNNVALYAQGVFKHRLANATIGFRYEKNNRYGAAFVPRLALTKKIENFHFKVLYSQAFRAPSIQNINQIRSGKAKPERSNVFELELGYQFTPEMLLAVNGFSITTRNVLIYGSETNGTEFDEWYENFDKSGTNGFEVVYSIKKKSWYANLSYSFSKPISDNTVDTYQVSGQSQQYLGMLAQKITTTINWYATDNLSINAGIIYGGKRYGYTALDEFGDPEVNKIDPYVLSNIFINYKDVVKGLTLGAGVYDLFNEKPVVVQAYNGEFGPIPGRSREYIVKLSYQLNFKSNAQ
jgi:outer membrane receptor for ferrienterochelin and colicin